MAITYFAKSEDLHAQVIYTDIDPDIILFNDSDNYALDLNNDGITDFNFKIYKFNEPDHFYFTGEGYFSVYYKWLAVSAAESNYIAASNPSLLYPYVLNTGDLIDDEVAWKHPDYLAHLVYYAAIVNYPVEGSFLPFYTGGNWFDQRDKFMACQFQIGENTHYGWVRLEVIKSDTIIIKDYAYKVLPNDSLYAGEGLIQDVIQNANSSNIFIYSFGNRIYGMFRDDSPDNICLRVFHLNGKQVLVKQIYRDDFILELPFISTGIYMIQLESTAGVFQKKVFINNN